MQTNGQLMALWHTVLTVPAYHRHTHTHSGAYAQDTINRIIKSSRSSAQHQQSEIVDFNLFLASLLTSGS